MTQRDDGLPDWPDRLVMRFIVLFHTRLAILNARMVGGSFPRAILLAPLIRQGLAEARRSATMTVNAMAASTGIPYETARRHVATLIADGLCERTATGIGLSDSLRGDPRLLALVERTDRELRAFLGSLRAMDVPLPACAPRCVPDRDVFTRTAMDLSLVGIEYWRRAYAMPIDMLTFGAVSIENCYPFTADRAACRRYGDWDTPPPEAIKRPVTVMAIATRLAVPYPTVWRSARRLQDDGRLLVTPRGLVSCNAPTDAVFRTARKQLIDYFRSRLRRLAQAGFDLDGIARTDLARRGKTGGDLHGDAYLSLPA